jgi:hypothetical protein
VPVICLKTRWKWNRLIPAASASSARLGISSLARIRAQARPIAAMCRSAEEPSFGRHRLHGRKPAASAAAAFSWNATFSRRGWREAQPGRQ